MSLRRSASPVPPLPIVYPPTSQSAFGSGAAPCTTCGNNGATAPAGSAPFTINFPAAVASGGGSAPSNSAFGVNNAPRSSGTGSGGMMQVLTPSVPIVYDLCSLITDPQAAAFCNLGIRNSAITPSRVYGVGLSLQKSLLPTVAPLPTAVAAVARNAAQSTAATVGTYAAIGVGVVAALVTGAPLAAMVANGVMSPRAAFATYAVVMLGVLALLAVVGWFLSRSISSTLETSRVQMSSLVQSARQQLAQRAPSIITDAADAYLLYSPQPANAAAT